MGAEKQGAEKQGAGTQDPETQGWGRRLSGYAWRYRRNVVLALGSSLAGMAVMALVPLITKVIIDDVVGSHTRSLGVWTGLLIGAAVLVYISTFVRRYYGGRLALDVQHDLRTEMYGTLTRLDGRRQDELSTGQVVGRATSDLQLIQSLLFMLPMTIGNILLFLISLVIMAWLSLPLTLVALAVAPALWFIARRSKARLFPATWYAQSQAAAVAGVVDGAVSGVRVVKGFGQEEQETGKLREVSRRLFAGRLRTIRLNSRYTPALQAVPALGQVAMLALGGWLATRGEITLGTFVAFSTYLAQLVGPVRMLAMVLTVGQQARAGVERVLELIDTEPSMEDGTKTLPADAPASVEFDDVRFGYDDDRPVLDGFSLTIEPGETVAVVGASGSGKSTVSLLLPRFYDVSHGAVLVGGHDVRELTQDSLRAAIGLVPEDSFLFSDTVRANIAYGYPGATQEQIERAARAAQAHGFISELPEGYDTKVGEHGLTLSGGQRQRVALARAILTDPRLLLLDDATSAVDARVEHEIHEVLAQVMEGRTTLLIAHRRSTLGLADRIAVLDQGRLADIGTHEELERRSALYRRLLTDPDELGGTSPGHQPSVTAEPRGRPSAPGRAGRGVRRRARSHPRAVDPQGGAARRGGRRDARHPRAARPGRGAAARHGRPRHRRGARGRGRRSRTGCAGCCTASEPPLLVSLALVAVDAGMGLLLPVLIRHGIDDGVTKMALGAVWAAAGLGLLAVLAQWAAQIGETRMTGRTGERVLYSLRVKIFAQLQRLGLDYYERELTGRIMTRMTTDVDALSTFLQTGLVTAFVSVVTFFGILVALLVLDVQLALVVFATLPLLIVGTFFFRRKSVKAYELARERISVVNADLQESVAGLRIVQAFRREQRRRRAVRRAQRRLPPGPGARPVADLGLLPVRPAAVLGRRGRRADRRRRPGATTARSPRARWSRTCSTSTCSSPPCSSSPRSSTATSRPPSPSAGSRSCCASRPPRPTPDDAAGRAVAARRDRLRGRRASAYGRRRAGGGPGRHRPADPGRADGRLRRRDRRGQVHAGQAGRPVLRPDRRRVTVDGTDLRELDLTAYRHRLGVVPQEPYLFAGTVRDAIAYGRPEATDAEVEAAARAVGAHDMIATLDGRLPARGRRAGPQPLGRASAS